MSPHTTYTLPYHTHYSYHINTLSYHTCPMHPPPHTHHSHPPPHFTHAIITPHICIHIFTLPHTLFTPHTPSFHTQYPTHTPLLTYCTYCTLTTHTPLCTHSYYSSCLTPPYYIYILHITYSSSHIFTDDHHIHTTYTALYHMLTYIPYTTITTIPNTH